MGELLVLDNDQIDKKIKRLAYEIYEQNCDIKTLYLGGINNNGLAFAKILKKNLKKISNLKIELVQIKMNPADPMEEISLSISAKDLQKKTIIVVDDVANTGRSIFYACNPLLESVPLSIQVAVLVDRKHKSFPIKVDYVGLSLATTFKENIRVILGKEKSVYLQ